jgi:LmbE family N-acetylglucosaminyl deacetylase
VPYTLVAFHAHPDDEALLTAGTLAKAAAEGHRVVIVVATSGEAGLAGSQYFGSLGSLGSHRLAELDRSAHALGVARVVNLGYADSGMREAPSGHPDSFATADVESAAARLAAVLVEEQADVLTTYDRSGGYGHPDHVAVHYVGARAGVLAATPTVLQATVDRRLLLRALTFLKIVARPLRLPGDFAPERFKDAYAAHDELTHRIDVRGYIGPKRAAMAAHASQATTSADFAARTLTICLRFPRALFRLGFGHEWFVEAGRTPVRPLVDDVFASVRTKIPRNQGDFDGS